MLTNFRGFVKTVRTDHSLLSWRPVFGGVLTLVGQDRHGVRLGATLVLHTGARELECHPHGYCVVTAGGLTLDGKKSLHHQGLVLAVTQLKARFRARLIGGLDNLR